MEAGTAFVDAQFRDVTIGARLLDGTDWLKISVLTGWSKANEPTSW